MKKCSLGNPATNLGKDDPKTNQYTWPVEQIAHCDNRWDYLQGLQRLVRAVSLAPGTDQAGTQCEPDVPVELTNKDAYHKHDA
jgi:hypothetical protein